MQTSGLILDVYDDYRGETIRALFPTRSQIPDLVKQAGVLSAEDRSRLPDDAFALVLLEGDQKLRKYACIDAGNTALSVLYFAKHGHKLPEEARAKTAENLEVACSWYEVDPDEVLKTAGLGTWAMSKAVEHPLAALQVAMVAPMAAHELRENNAALSEIRRERDFTGPPVSPSEIHERRMLKGAMAHLVPGHKGESGNFGPEENSKEQDYTKGEMPKALPQAKVMKPHVDVTGKHASVHQTKKVASVYALRDRYPLDSYAQVKAASVYFDEHGKSFSPENRREFCQNLLKRAEALNIEVSDSVRHYGGEEFGTPDMLKQACDLRLAVLQDPVHREMVTSLFEKTAELGPELFCETLSEFDKVAGLNYLYDSDVPDPFYSTFYKAAESMFSFVDGNDMINEADLRRLSKIGTKAIKHTFGEDFMVEFQKDPVGIFKSLPREQKKMIMHMANDNSAPGIALLS